MTLEHPPVRDLRQVSTTETAAPLEPAHTRDLATIAVPRLPKQDRHRVVQLGALLGALIFVG
ncbi:MAG: hypothetical protein J2P54_21615, partial [Bradyrhizobiaceae bacterium]|nr:hypothetical protein [Bradyrhizobiaceae bacterium]